MTIHELPTPALLLNHDVFERNLRHMAQQVAKAGKKLRPHAKAHKCVNIARRQIEAGAVGVCVATVPEAELMARAEIPNLLLTSPIADPFRCTRIAELPDVSVVVDHVTQVQMYAKAAELAGVTLTVFIDLDVGDHRTGIPPGVPALELAQQILRHPGLRLLGIQAYSVRASHMSETDGRAAFTGAALQQALDTRKLLHSSGIECPEITGGSTGSYAEDAVLPYVTELQAGSYALMDVAYKKIGIQEFGNALTVLATVISANHQDRVTVDAGFKAFATDRAFGPEPFSLEGAKFGWAGDEFGYVFLDRSQHQVKLGDRLRFLPPHCDPNVNLYDRIHVCENDQVLDVWPVMDRYHAD